MNNKEKRFCERYSTPIMIFIALASFILAAISFSTVNLNPIVYLGLGAAFSVIVLMNWFSKGD